MKDERNRWTVCAKVHAGRAALLQRKHARAAAACTAEVSARPMNTSTGPRGGLQTDARVYANFASDGRLCVYAAPATCMNCRRGYG
jgi:hypothetical protein